MLQAAPSLEWVSARSLAKSDSIRSCSSLESKLRSAKAQEGKQPAASLAANAFARTAADMVVIRLRSMGAESCCKDCRLLASQQEDRVRD